MSDLQNQLILLVVDKGILALLIGIVAFYGKRYLDRKSAQNAYEQELAKERIHAYKEISLIVAEQVMMMGKIPRILQRPADTDEAKKKLATDFLQCYNGLAEHWTKHTPKLKAHIIFMSPRVADLIISYLDVFNGFMSIPHERPDKQSELPAKGVIAVAGDLHHALAEEINDFRL